MNTTNQITIKLPVPHLIFAKFLATGDSLLDLFSVEQINTIQTFVLENLSDRDGAPMLNDLKTKLLKYENDSAI
ncbi:hypothetical protein [Sphingobacterium sp. LRF_L2]|uniref:hypothetical protein n=1 Tax=Sphingobacterium sp. LRF_L2 TaxID=3369421 RepID=UPI003F5E310B